VRARAQWAGDEMVPNFNGARVMARVREGRWLAMIVSMLCADEGEGADDRCPLGRGRTGVRAKGCGAGEWGRAGSERERALAWVGVRGDRPWAREKRGARGRGLWAWAWANVGPAEEWVFPFSSLCVYIYI
jgi:hypothetical protein